MTVQSDRRAYDLLRFGLGAVFVIAGADVFLHVLGNWGRYLADPIAYRLGADTARASMHAIGAGEIVLAILVAAKPRVGSWVALGWLVALTAQLVLGETYLELAFVTACLGAPTVALLRLSAAFDADAWGIVAPRAKPASDARAILRWGFAIAIVIASLGASATFAWGWRGRVAAAIAIGAGSVVALKPRLGAVAVAGCMGALLVGVVHDGRHLQVALCDVGLLVGAGALALLPSAPRVRAS